MWNCFPRSLGPPDVLGRCGCDMSGVSTRSPALETDVIAFNLLSSSSEKLLGGGVVLSVSCWWVPLWPPLSIRIDRDLNIPAMSVSRVLVSSSGSQEIIYMKE